MAFADNGGVRLYWKLEGAAGKPVLLLLNSIGTDMSLWDRAAPHLLPQFRLLRMDTRGHGASDAPPDDYSLETLARDAQVVMDAAGVERACVCGLSLGGMIAMTLALQAPRRIEALILACTSPQMDKALWTQRVETVRTQGLAAIVDGAMARFFSEGFVSHHPEVTDTARAGLLAMNPCGYAACGAAIRDMDLIGRISAIQAPTLVIHGRQDISTPYAGHADQLLARIEGAQAAALDAAHLACVEAPTAFAGAIRGFVSGLAEQATGEAAETLFEAGLKVRRKVLGDAWVDRSLSSRTPFNADFQAMITRYAWQEIWGRPGLDHRTRRLIVIAITTALGRWEEFRLHVRAGLEQGGFTEDELKEVLMQSAIYAGVPAANTAFAEAAAVIRGLEAETPNSG
ncbi:bifunctional 3-oxoadipate enol-lactonase/4-carboxymuconolactone decarboxylase PcaDC [Phenylobacterium montanum]|uniref:3-oxoadipate enol-lactonase n=1 Tax=Phenylobacterium montanum TaxID=2823693 RepID=A0A975G2A5_9CAUL|nr:3-oxoadipate enol-lactonase [Caulobacter sp. S6]QUD89187.1 3-oxoadipate enol-lactonase [Caulobacter sp. S6]